MHGLAQAIKRLQGKRRFSTVLLLGAMLAAASLVSMPPGVPGEPTAADLRAAAEAAAEALPAEEEEPPSPPTEGEVPPPLPALEPAAGGGINDDFGVTTSDANLGGEVHFDDYGPGVPGNGKSNDDYIVISDRFEDGHGVKAYAWLNGIYLGSKYNGKGDGRDVIWDPFPHGNVKPGDYIGLKVCLVDGASDPTPSYCGSFSSRSQDG